MSERRSTIDMMFKFMEYDNLTEGEHDLVISFEEQWRSRGHLSERQEEILTDIFRRGNER